MDDGVGEGLALSGKSPVDAARLLAGVDEAGTMISGIPSPLEPKIGNKGAGEATGDSDTTGLGPSTDSGASDDAG